MEVGVDNGCARFGLASGLFGANKQCNSEKTRLRIGGGKSSERQKKIMEEKKWHRTKGFVRQVKAHVAEQRKKLMNAKGTSNTAEKILLEPNMTSQTFKRQATNK